MTSAYALIAEPNSARRSFWASNIAQEGLSCVVAMDGEEAIEVLCTAGPPALLLMELALPIVDGFRVIDRLRRVVPPEETPVIVVSAYREMREEAVLLSDRLGIGMILTPSVPADILRQVVRGLLTNQEIAPLATNMSSLPEVRTIGARGLVNLRRPANLRRSDRPPPPSSRPANLRRSDRPPPPPSSVSAPPSVF